MTTPLLEISGLRKAFGATAAGSVDVAATSDGRFLFARTGAAGTWSPSGWPPTVP